MIFLCFNTRDRESIAEQILYHMTSFGFHVWYDRKDIFLGDSRYKENIENGANNSNNNYSIVILSPNFSKGNYCKKELEIIKNRYLERKTIVFPILYNLYPEELDEENQWISNLVCKIVVSNEEKIYGCYHMVARITNQLLQNEKYKVFKDFLYHRTEKDYLYNLIYNYELLDMNNYNARMTILYSMYLYIKLNNNILNLEPYFYKGFEKLFSFTRLNIVTDKRELQILENLSLLLLSKYY